MARREVGHNTLAALQSGDTDFLKTARDRFRLADESDVQQRAREIEDLKFAAGDQWPVDLQQARQGQSAQGGMPAVPARPTLVINKIKEPVRQILNQERAADIGIEIVPADDFGDLGVTPDDTEITLREGLVRRIQRESHAADARTWAFSRAVQAGRGYYLVMTEYLPGKTFDQQIVIKRIHNQTSVLLDPAHEQPDGSDADWGFVGPVFMPAARFAEEFPKVLNDKGELIENRLTAFGTSDFEHLYQTYPDWYRGSGEDGKTGYAVGIVDYWYIERHPRDLVTDASGQTYWHDEAPKGFTPVQTRTEMQKVVKFCKIGGGLVKLEETDWAGPDIPIVKVVGDEIQPYDDENRFEGMVRPARSAQQGFNYMVSKQVEVIGLTPIPALQVDPEAILGYEALYQQSNVRAFPYLPYRTRDDNGHEFAPPHRPPVDPNILPIAQSIALFDQGIKSTTSVPDSTLGNVDPALKSGKAIREVVQNAQLSTSNFLDNLTRSIRYEGQIINNLLYPIYGQRPGRLVRIMTGENEAQTMQIGEPAPVEGQAPTPRAQAATVAKLTKDANLNVIVKVTKNYDSRRTQEATAIAELINSEPQLMGVFGDLFFKNSDMPGRMALAERAKVMLAPPVQQLLAAQEQGQPFDPVAQAKMAHLQQQLEQAGAIIQDLSKKAEGHQLDYQAKIQTEDMRSRVDLAKANLDVQKAQIDADRDLQLQEMKDATTIRVAEIEAATKGYQTDAQHAAQVEAQALDLTAAQVEAEIEREHTRQQADTARQHDVAMAGAQAGEARDQAEASHQHALEQGAQRTEGQIAVTKAKPQPKAGA